MMMIKTPWWLSAMFPKLLWRYPTSDKVLYLTFDDGPSPGITEKVLQELEKHQAKATFFVIGQKVKKYPKTLQAVREAGHSIGNHTYNHLNGWKTKASEYLANTVKAHETIQNRMGFEPKLFRPPYGRIWPKTARKLSKDYKVVMWDVIAGDFMPDYSKEKVLENVLKHSRSGSVIVLHDSEKCEEKMLYALPRILAHFTAQGYRFEAIPESIA